MVGIPRNHPGITQVLPLEGFPPKQEFLRCYGNGAPSMLVHEAAMRERMDALTRLRYTRSVAPCSGGICCRRCQMNAACARPPIAQRLVQYFANMRPIIPESAFPELTEREREVLALIVDGKSNPQIAEILSLSPKTVSNHISTIFSKLQVLDRAQAVTRARHMGVEGSAG
jgi:DNA-binding NarL/FixJ family response regulator